MWSITKEESMRIYSRSFVTSYNRRPFVEVYQGTSARVGYHQTPRSRPQLNIGVTFLLCGCPCPRSRSRSRSTEVLLGAPPYPDGYTGCCCTGCAAYPAKPVGGAPRFVGVVGVLREGGVRGGRTGGGSCLRIAVGGWPTMRESDQGTSTPDSPAAETYRAISR